MINAYSIPSRTFNLFFTYIKKRNPDQLQLYRYSGQGLQLWFTQHTRTIIFHATTSGNVPSDMCTRTIQISLRICTVWSESSLGPFQITKDVKSFFMLTMKTLIRLRRCMSQNLGPVVRSIVSLISSLRVISLTVLADSIYNILIFFAEKMWVAFALQKLHTFFQQKFQHICVSLHVNF